jgi:hypothetical protein
MLIRKAVLVSGLLLSLPAMCAEDSELRITGDKVVVSGDATEVLCIHCVVQLVQNSEVQVSASRIEADQATGSIHLEGAVHITFKNGGELRSERVTMSTGANGFRALSGDEIHFIRTALR